MKQLFPLLLISLLFSCKNSSSDNSDYDSTLTMPAKISIAAPEAIIFSVQSVYPHDPTAFTQGLEFHDGKLYEGTGELGKSRLRLVDISSGKAEKDHTLEDASLFGEGITIFKNKLYQLTWQNKKIFEYSLQDFTMPLNSFNWNGEGWGLTHDGENMIISDGTSKLYFVQPDEQRKEMKINKIISVINNLGEVDSINELEYIDGFIYANVWHRDDIIKIDPANGHVVGVMNLKGLLQQYSPGVTSGEEDVLNGIAWDPAAKILYITGKKWPKLFAIRINQ